MFPAESAVFLDFHSVRMSFLILGSIVVTLLAFCAGQSDFCTHFATSICFVKKILFLCFEHKKKT